MSAETKKSLASIGRDIAQVFFASVFVGPLVAGSLNIALPTSGLVLALLTWYLSILVEQPP